MTTQKASRLFLHAAALILTGVLLVAGFTQAESRAAGTVPVHHPSAPPAVSDIAVVPVPPSKAETP